MVDGCQGSSLQSKSPAALTLPQCGSEGLATLILFFRCTFMFSSNSPSFRLNMCSYLSTIFSES